MLNPIRADVTIGLKVIPTDDKIGKAALDYSNLVKDALAISNLSNTVGEITDIIPF